MTTTQLVPVRFRRPFQGYKGGQVVRVPRGQARSLELFGRADIVREPQFEFAVAPEPAGVEVAVAPVAKAKRPRRRKAT